MAEKFLTKKIILLAGCASLWMAPLSASAMEIIFDKTYNISRTANLTSLNWKSVTFTQISGGRIKYTLIAQHPEGKSLEYLPNADSVVSEEIKSRLIRKFDIVTSEITFKDGEAHLEVELPYDFETRYLPIKLHKKDGYEDYVVRFRFGDYRFLVANKVINRTSAKDVSNIAGKDPNDLYKVRKQARRRVIIKKQEEAPTYSVDDIYAEAKQATTSGADAVASGGAAKETGGRATANAPAAKAQPEESLFSQFENLAQQYGTETIEVDRKTAEASAAPQKEDLPEELPAKEVESVSGGSLVNLDDMTLSFEEAPLEEEEVVSVDEQTASELVSIEEKALESDTPSWITPSEPAKESQLVEQKIDEIETESEQEDYEGTLFQKFESASNKYNERLENIQKQHEAEKARAAQEFEQLSAGNEEKELDSVEEMVQAEESLSNAYSTETVEAEPKKEEPSEFLIYQTVETPEVEEEELFVESSEVTSTEVASVPSVPSYTAVPDDGSIPWLEETTESVLSDDSSSQRDISSTPGVGTSVYDAAPQPKSWVFKFSKGFVFKKSEEEDRDSSRQPDSEEDAPFEESSSGGSFEDEELGVFKKKE